MSGTYRRAQQVPSRKKTKRQFVPRTGRSEPMRGDQDTRLILATSDPAALDVLARTVRISGRPNNKAVVFEPRQLAECPLMSLEPTRRPGFWTDMRNRPALATMKNSGESVWVESDEERWVTRDLNVDPDVSAFVTQPLLLEWEFEGLYVEHTPDMLVEHVDGSRTLLNVKPSEFRDEPRTAAKFRLTERTAHLLGWAYEDRAEAPEQYQANFNDFYGARRQVGDEQRALAKEVAASMEFPATFGDLCARFGVGCDAQWLAMHCIITGLLWCDFSQRVTPRMPIFAGPQGERPWIRRTETPFPAPVTARGDAL